MSKELTEAKELNRQAAEKIKEYELLEEARRRGFISGAKIKSALPKEIGSFIMAAEPYVSEYGNVLCRNFGNNIVVMIYDKTNDTWAEIIPEEDDIYLSLVQEKSLHDQIREGGWEKVFELFGSNLQLFIPTDYIHTPEIELKLKSNAYLRLLALSKVLNEGEEDEGYLYVIKLYNKKFEINSFSLQVAMYPIYFYDQRDASFSLEFAEKEWKIFYNSNQ